MVSRESDWSLRSATPQLIQDFVPNLGLRIAFLAVLALFPVRRISNLHILKMGGRFDPLPAPRSSIEYGFCGCFLPVTIFSTSQPNPEPSSSQRLPLPSFQLDADERSPGIFPIAGVPSEPYTLSCGVFVLPIQAHSLVCAWTKMQKACLKSKHRNRHFPVPFCATGFISK
jgi:hypothetical protein